jgi:hypothetical protein
VATVGPRVLGRLVELQWEEIDAQAVARSRARHTPGSVAAEGQASVLAARRCGTLAVRRPVVTHRDGRPHDLPGTDLVPAHEGLMITRGRHEQACLLPHDRPCATAARLRGWPIGAPTGLRATTLRTLVRAHGGRIRSLEQGEACTGRLAYPRQIRTVHSIGATAAWPEKQAAATLRRHSHAEAERWCVNGRLVSPVACPRIFIPRHPSKQGAPFLQDGLIGRHTLPSAGPHRVWA